MMNGFRTLPPEIKFAEAIGAPLFNGNGWANTSLIQSEPLVDFYLQLSFSINSCIEEIVACQATHDL